MIRDESSIGEFEFSGNETKTDATIDDAPKARGGRPTPGALYVISGDFLVPDPDNPGQKKRLERAAIYLEAASDGSYGGGISFHAQRPGTVGDADMITLMHMNTKCIVAHVPIVAEAGILSVEPKWPWEDTTHGIPAGNFEEVARIYGFPSDEFVPYVSGRMTWEQVITKQDERDGYRHFPPAQAPQLFIPQPPPPPPDEPTETHGFAPGDFATIEQAYGFPSDDKVQYAEGRMTWPRVIEHMDERNDYKLFPKGLTVHPFTEDEDDGA